MNSDTLQRQLINFDTSSSQVYVDNFYPLDSSFVAADSESNFKINLARLHDTWIYRTKSIQYTLNGQYYRCEPFENIDWSNSIVMFGCSNAFGVGVDDADTISSRLKELTGCNVVNLGVVASCQQISLYNMMILKNNNIRPRAVIHLWADSNRPFSVDKHYNIQFNGPWNNFGFSNDVSIEVLDEIFGKSKSGAISAMFNRMITNSLYTDIPVIHATHFNKMWDEQNLKYPNFPMMLLPIRDLARDCRHPGIDSNILAAKLLHEKLIKFKS